MNRKHVEKLLNSPKISISERESINATLTYTEPGTCPESPAYDPELDSVIESYWNVRKGDVGGLIEERNPAAERTYMDLVSVLVCGGVESEAEETALRLLPIFEVCRSAWIRKHVARALFTLYVIHHEAIGSRLAHKILAVLEPAAELVAAPADGGDWLSLCSTRESP